MAKGKLNFRQLVNGSLKCGQLPIIAWFKPEFAHPHPIEVEGSATGCDSSNFTVWRTMDQIDSHKLTGRFDFMVTCLECHAVTAVHANIWKDMRS